VGVRVVIVGVGDEDDRAEVGALEAAGDERQGEAGRVRYVEAESDVREGGGGGLVKTPSSLA
jgi:hypothetical protein